MLSSELITRAIAVYCGSSLGTETAYRTSATSLGQALTAQNRPVVYGGGSKGIMGIVSGAVLKHGGQVTGVVPSAMIAAAGEAPAGDSATVVHAGINEAGREKVESIVVSSMHERKVEMAQRACGFVGLPGGFGTFEEVLEVVTWTQLGIHNKPVVLVNVLGFWEPLRALVQSSIRAGFIKRQNESLVIFVDGPADHEQHDTYDWGSSTLAALDGWKPLESGLYKWADGTSKSVDRLQILS